MSNIKDRHLNFLLFPPKRIEQLFRAIIKAEKPIYQVDAILTTPS
jgi:hypothetical protein